MLHPTDKKFTIISIITTQDTIIPNYFMVN
jgi:hypothetical protein